MFEVKGYAFIHKENNEIEKMKFKDGAILVENWEEVEPRLKELGIYHYLITLKGVRK